jgi:phosphoserine phosphatase
MPTTINTNVFNSSIVTALGGSGSTNYQTVISDLNLSSDLVALLNQAQADGWKVVLGTSGGGSYANPKNSQIVIDPNELATSLSTTEIVRPTS